MVIDSGRGKRQHDSTDRIASRYVSNEKVYSFTPSRLMHAGGKGNIARSD